jgi:hypothetical protein
LPLFRLSFAATATFTNFFWALSTNGPWPQLSAVVVNGRREVSHGWATHVELLSALPLALT